MKEEWKKSSTSDQTTILFRPVGQTELEFVEKSGWRGFPRRLPHQPFFYPVLSEEYAVQIARDWNTKDEVSGFVGYVLRVAVRTDFLNRYEIRVAGSAKHRELWIPAEDLEQFNENIVGKIEVIHRFSKSPP